MGKKLRTINVPKSQGGPVVLIPEEDIEAYLRSIEDCPFCGEQKLTVEESHSSCVVTCGTCEFSLSSHNLYMYSEVKRGMKTVEDVLSEPIEAEVKKYKQEITDKLVAAIFQMDRQKRLLALHVRFH